MYGNDNELREALRAAEMSVAPDPAQVSAVRARLAVAARRGIAHRRRVRAGWAVGLVLCGACGAALGATETGRSLVRWILTPVLSRHEVTVTTSDEDAAALFEEIAALSQAGQGELVALYEVPDGTVYSIRYALADGSSTTVATRDPTGIQALMMRLDEIQRLRDAGAGDLIAAGPGPLGLGAYTIRFTLADRTVDVQTWYPPGPRAGREAIFAETRLLKAAGLFSVEQAGVSVEDPQQGVTGTLRYTLADGRTVGIVERVPDELVTPDGAYVVAPDTGETVALAPGGFWAAPDGSLYVSTGPEGSGQPGAAERSLEQLREIHGLKAAGAGELVGLLEGPGWDGELSTTSYRVRYTLEGGGTVTVAEGAPSGPQRAAMKLDEIQRLRDAGAGEIVSRDQSRLGLGSFTIRFTLADGRRVDLHAVYPPGTRRQREAIFAETRKLTAQRRFTVVEARAVPGSGVGGILAYTLADGRRVDHFEPVPTDLITSGGTHVVQPGTGELLEIAGAAGN
jgi:hypothetical protein